ncbi:MAG: hypothetical protein WBD62_01890 [Anaerolineales bacterium]
MLPKNVIMMKEFDRQGRARLQKEAENARILRSNKLKAAPKLNLPGWEFTMSKFRLIRMRLGHAN